MPTFLSSAGFKSQINKVSLIYNGYQTVQWFECQSDVFSHYVYTPNLFVIFNQFEMVEKIRVSINPLTYMICWSVALTYFYRGAQCAAIISGQWRRGIGTASFTWLNFISTRGVTVRPATPSSVTERQDCKYVRSINWSITHCYWYQWIIIVQR